MDADPDKQAENSRRGGIGPGERLQAARIKKGLSVEDVANRMHLSTSILEAIEENNFDEITAPIFVKGYLRAYARIVALSEDEMIEQYLEMYSEEDPPISSTSNVVPELSSADARIKWTTYFVIALLAVFLAAWWWNKQQNIEAPVSLDVQSPTLAEKASDEVVIGSGIEAGSEAVDVVVVDEAADAPDSSTEQSLAMAADPGLDSSTTLSSVAPEIEVVEGEADVEPNEVALAESDTSAAAPEPVVVTLATQADSSAASDAADSVAVAALPESTPVAAPAQDGTRQRPGRSAPTGSDKLRIVVHADTWADVKDSSNYQLVYDLLRADSTVELTGAAPFSVFLGNGHGVEVLFNGEEFGFSSRIRDDNTARLKIGG